jgi:hypothetical protein
MPAYKPPTSQPHRAELAAMLDNLEAALPKMIAEHKATDGDFWCAFAGESDVIEDLASTTEDVEYVRRRLDLMLVLNGKDPDSDVPCDG